MRYLIADLVVEFTPCFDNLKNLAKPFLYDGNRETDTVLNLTEEVFEKQKTRYVKGSPDGEIENALYSMLFNKASLKFGCMLIHSSVVVHKGGGYLFSASSGVGKSTHTRLWLKEFPDEVHILNDDKPVIRFFDGIPYVCGTPFDGGSGIALNETVPLKAIVFIDRAEKNSIRVPNTSEVLKRLYFSTVHMLDRETAEKMLDTFTVLLPATRFYILSCNMDPSAAHVSYDAIIEK